MSNREKFAIIKSKGRFYYPGAIIKSKGRFYYPGAIIKSKGRFYYPRAIIEFETSISAGWRLVHGKAVIVADAV
ncbi:MAG: hypothetical protein NC432_02655 [Roseburia sp.]|nr:hypothetical protein [Roseburia sp.]MCM1097138.1 hypothetical protein [Ruminococcus flavefaciens]